MQLNPSEISELIKSRINELGVDSKIRNEGTVISVTDGICRIMVCLELCKERCSSFLAAPLVWH